MGRTGGATIDGCIDLWEKRDVPDLVCGLVNLRSESPFKLCMASEEYSVDIFET
jgi:hypothetical protein